MLAFVGTIEANKSAAPAMNSMSPHQSHVFGKTDVLSIDSKNIMLPDKVLINESMVLMNVARP